VCTHSCRTEMFIPVVMHTISAVIGWSLSWNVYVHVYVCATVVASSWTGVAIGIEMVVNTAGVTELRHSH